MASVKTKLGSLEKFDQSKKRKEWKLKIHRKKIETSRKDKMKKDEERRVRHAAHLRACAAKAIMKADRLEAKTV